MFDTRPTVWYNTHMTNRNDTLYILLMFLFIFAFALCVSYGMGYLIGGGLAYFGWNVNPSTVAWLFFAASALSYTFTLLAGRNR